MLLQHIRHGIELDYPRELCGRWNWQRPDGQIKDMACRELLRKLESRALIKLPPRHRYGPGRPAEIEPIAVDQSPASCLLSDIKPVKIVNVRDYPEYEKAFNYLLKEYSLSQLCTPGRSEHEIHDRWAKRTFSMVACCLEQPPGRPRLATIGLAGRWRLASEILV